MSRPSTPAVFWANTKKDRDCLIWSGVPHHAGYGEIHYQGKRWLVHRLAWYLIHKEIPKKDVLHKCDRPLCIKPAHLFLGTHAENMLDMHKKGRSTWKITLNQIYRIQAMSKYKKQKEVGDYFGIHQSTVSRIKNKNYPYREKDLETISDR